MKLKFTHNQKIEKSTDYISKREKKNWTTTTNRAFPLEFEKLLIESAKGVENIADKIKRTHAQEC